MTQLPRVVFSVRTMFSLRSECAYTAPAMSLISKKHTSVSTLGLDSSSEPLISMAGTGTVVSTLLLVSPLEDIGPERLRSLPFCALYFHSAEGEAPLQLPFSLVAWSGTIHPPSPRILQRLRGSRPELGFCLFSRARSANFSAPFLCE